MLFFPTLACYMSTQDAYRKYLASLPMFTNMAVAMVTMSVAMPLLLTPKTK